MNERIKQLAGKALDKAVPYTWHNLDHVEVEKVMKEFAELIVDAVYDHILDATMHDNPFPFREDVKKHFGVK